jgi:hypothetical protein
MRGAGPPYQASRGATCAGSRRGIARLPELVRRRVMEDGRLGGSAADFPPYPAWQVLLFCGPLEPLKASDLFGQMFVEPDDLKHPTWSVTKLRLPN